MNRDDYIIYKSNKKICIKFRPEEEKHDGLNTNFFLRQKQRKNKHFWQKFFIISASTLTGFQIFRNIKKGNVLIFLVSDAKEQV